MNNCKDWNGKDFGFINFAPDGSVSEKHRAWQGCPSVAVTKKGRMFAAWYTGGAMEPCIYNYNILVKSDDGGQSWSAPLLTVNTDYENRMRNIDAELWITEENHLWVMWTKSPYYETSKPRGIKIPFECDYHKEFLYTELMVCKDPDGDTLVWEKPRVICGGFMRNKPIKTAVGRIIAPAYDYGGDAYAFRYSDDGGERFYDVFVPGKPDINVFDEMSVYENAAGRLRFLARTRRGCYLYAESLDGGDSWSEVKPFEKAPSTRCYIGRLRSGRVAYVRNLADDARTGMKICLSEDGGDTFPYELVLDTREHVSYPDLDEDQEGNIYIVYDRERYNGLKLDKETWISQAAKEILLCKVTEADILTGSLGEGSYLRRIVSKGQKNIVEY